MTARILIVDDTVANLRLLEARLAAEYYEVKSLRDGRGVIAFAADWQPDVILLDVVMPEMNGYDACRLLKASEATSHIPVIMMTANEEIPDRVQALACGADELLTRPAENSILLARLRGTIHLKRVLDEWRMRRATALALGLAPNILDDAPSELGRVLIVDDLVVRALRLRDVLAQAGMTTVLMQHESAAAEAMEDVAPDLIAISLTLMAGDPLRLVAKLRASDTTRNTPLLLIAEANQRSLMIAGLDLGANDCLVLPLDESEFLLRVGNHVRRKLYRDRLRTDVNTALRLAVIDPLTRLYNRRYVIGHLDALYETSGPREFSVLMIDVDRFKMINDRYGHGVGDRVLRTIAELIGENLREGDLAARFGGEEFVVVVQAAEIRAVAIAERLRLAVEQAPIAPHERVTISVGVASSNGATCTVDLLDQADTALYSAKRSGRNRVASCPVRPDKVWA